MRHRILSALLFACALGCARAEGPTTTTVTGTVLSMSGYNLAIETAAGNRMDLELGSDSVLPTGVETGDRVVVSYAPGESGVSHVIEVARSGAASTDSAVAPASVAPVPREPAVVARSAANAKADEAIEERAARRWVPWIGVLVLASMVVVGLFLRSRR